MKEAVTDYLRDHGPAYMGDIEEAIGSTAPWPDEIVEMVNEGELAFNPRTSKWSLTSMGEVEA
jgi:hypothetical protein